MKAILDKKSNDFFAKNFDKIEGDLNKCSLLKAFDNSFKSLKPNSMKILEFLNVLTESIESVSLSVLVSVFEKIHYIIGYFVSNEDYKSYKKAIFNKLYSRIKTETCSETVPLLLDTIIDFAKDSEDIQTLKNWYHSKDEVLSKYPLTLIKKWRITFLVHASTSFTDEQKKEMFDEVFNNDTTDLKIEYQTKIQGLIADDAQRQEIINKLLSKDSELNLNYVHHMGAGFNSRHVSIEKRMKFHDLFFKSVPEIVSVRSTEIAKYILIFLCPLSDCDLEGTINKLKEMKGAVNSDLFLMKKIIQNKIEHYDEIFQIKSAKA